MKNIIKDYFGKLILGITLIYFLVIFKFILTSDLLQLSQNPKINRNLNLLIIIFLGGIGFGGMYLFKRFLNLRIMDKQFIRILIIVLITLIPRLIWISLVDITPKSDFGLYNTLAEAYSRGESAGGKYVALFPHTFGYPYILGIVYRLLSPNKLWALILNILFEIGTGLLIYKIGSMISNWKAGFTAAVIWGLWISHIFYSSVVSTEQLYTFLMVLLIYIYFKISSKNLNLLHSCGLYFLVGILCAFTNAIRPLALILIIAMGLIEVMKVINKEKGLKQAAIPIVSLIIAYFVCFNIIGMFISHKVGYTTAKNPIGFNMYVGSNINFSGMWNQYDSDEVSEMIKQDNFDAQEVHNKLIKMAIQRIKNHGFGYLRFALRKNEVLWGRDDEIVTYMLAGTNTEDASLVLDINRYQVSLRRVCNYFFYIIAILAFLGLISQFKAKESQILTFLMLLFLGIGAVHTIVEVHGRYHYSAIVVLCVLAGLVFERGKVFKKV